MLNQVIIQGNLTRDPQIRFFNSGDSVASFSIANNQKVGGNDVTTFLDCTIWNKQAEALANHTRKGSQIIVEGQLRQESWDDRTTGQKRTKYVLKAQRFHFCGTKAQSPSPAPPAPQPVAAPVAAVSTAQPVAAPQVQPVTTAPITPATVPQAAPVAAPVAAAPQPVSTATAPSS